jgi:hypothetical protein
MNIPQSIVRIFLMFPNGQIAAQLRDNIPGIASQGMLSTFGGGVDFGESPQQAACERWRKKIVSQPIITKWSLSQILVTKRLKNIEKFYKTTTFFCKSERL